MAPSRIPPSGRPYVVVAAAWFACGTLLLPASTLTGQSFHRDFDFATDAHGFTAGFADLPANYNPDIYDLSSAWEPRPTELGGAPALRISGTNRSDDLWMFWKKRLSDLTPDTAYTMTVGVEFASKYPEDSRGVGGSPGDSVYLKTGAVSFEPLAVQNDQGNLRMNLDKGNQSQSGKDAAVRGTVAKPPDGTSDYVLLTRHHHGDPQTVRTSPSGDLWVIVGTDSGFESTTTLYYTRFQVWLTPADQPALWLESEPGTGASLVWNQGYLTETTDLKSKHWDRVDNPPRPFPIEFAESARFFRVKTRSAAK